MKHVGNDVVDLKAAAAIGRSRDTRFLQRVLGAAEIESVLAADRPDSLLWAFWAAKETAYKVISKSHPGVTSAPRRYPVTVCPERTEGGARGVVNTPCGAIPVKWAFTEDYVHCVGGDAGGHMQEARLDKIKCGLNRIDTCGKPGSRVPHREESVQVRRHAAAHIASLLSLNPGGIHISRAEGPPVVCIEDGPEDIDVSLSHDGRFLAHAFLLGS